MFEYFKSLFAAKPPVTSMHPEFGLLTHERGYWSGQVHRDGRDIRFNVAGDETTPDAGLLASLCDILGRFREVERAALEYICGLESSVKPEGFTFSELGLPWADKRTDFVLTFSLEGDAYGIWRFEFQNGQ